MKIKFAALLLGALIVFTGCRTRPYSYSQTIYSSVENNDDDAIAALLLALANKKEPVKVKVVQQPKDTVKYVQVSFSADALFATGSYKLSKKAQGELADFAKNINESMEISIYGHTDNAPFKGCTAAQSHAKNQKLSEDRAQSVCDYLQKCGVKASQIKEVKGYGEDNPVADNSTAEGKQQNRRVDVRIKTK